MRVDILQHCREALADTGNVSDFTFGVGENIRNPFRIAFDSRRAIAIAADAKAVLARDLHQIAGLVQNACEVAIFQAFSLPA